MHTIKIGDEKSTSTNIYSVVYSTLNFYIQNEKYLTLDLIFEQGYQIFKFT